MGKGFASVSSAISELVPLHLALSSLKWGRAKDWSAVRGAKLWPPSMHGITSRRSKCAGMRNSIIATMKKSSLQKIHNMGKDFCMIHNNLLLTWRPLLLFMSIEEEGNISKVHPRLNKIHVSIYILYSTKNSIGEEIFFRCSSFK